MAALDLTVNSTPYSLPQPMQNGYSIRGNARGKGYQLASGARVWETTSAGLFRTFVIEWTGLTHAQRGTIDTAVGAMLTYGSGTWECPTGGSYTVVLGDTLPVWKVRKTKAGTTLAYSGSLTLEQNA